MTDAIERLRKFVNREQSEPAPSFNDAECRQLLRAIDAPVPPAPPPHEAEAMWLLRHIPHDFTAFATEQADASRRFRAWKLADVGREMVLGEGLISSGKGSRSDGECG